MTRASFLQRLIGITGLGFLSVPEAQASRKIYLLQSFVAGFRFHKGMELLPVMQENDLLELRREPNNEHDAFAIALYWQQEMIGYLPAADNEPIARLLDAAALPLLGIITHLNRDTKPWENLAVAVYFLQPEKLQLPEHANYLTRLVTPAYATLKKQSIRSKEQPLPHVFDEYDRIIAVDEITDPAAKAYFEKNYAKHEMSIAGKRFLKVPDDGIYTYMYNVEATQWLVDEDDKKWLEFIFNED